MIISEIKTYLYVKVWWHWEIVISRTYANLLAVNVTPQSSQMVTITIVTKICHLYFITLWLFDNNHFVIPLWSRRDQLLSNLQIDTKWDRLHLDHTGVTKQLGKLQIVRIIIFVPKTSQHIYEISILENHFRQIFVNKLNHNGISLS